MADPELVERVQSVTQERAQVAAALAPRRREEARVLTRLRGRREALLDHLDATEADLENSDALREAALERLEALEAGLSARQRVWARVVEPLLLSAATLGALVPLGLGRSLWLALGAAAGGLVLGFTARLVWRRRG
jgi:hypothetical protein